MELKTEAISGSETFSWDIISNNDGIKGQCKKSPLFANVQNLKHGKIIWDILLNLEEAQLNLVLTMQVGLFL